MVTTLIDEGTETRFAAPCDAVSEQCPAEGEYVAEVLIAEMPDAYVRLYFCDFHYRKAKDAWFAGKSYQNVLDAKFKGRK